MFSEEAQTVSLSSLFHILITLSLKKMLPRFSSKSVFLKLQGMTSGPI